MFSNEFHSPAMDEFLDMIGDRVKLKGFKRYFPLLLMVQHLLLLKLMHVLLYIGN